MSELIADLRNADTLSTLEHTDMRNKGHECLAEEPYVFYQATPSACFAEGRESYGTVEP